MALENPQELWRVLRKEARAAADAEAALASYFHGAILNHHSFVGALSYQLACRLDSQEVPAILLHEMFSALLSENPTLEVAVIKDLLACLERDPACNQCLMPLLYFKGFHALQTQRMAHCLWQQGRQPLALFLQSRMAQAFDVDIHPGARLGQGIFMDHATGVVIGETAVLDDNVSLLHSVTLGGSGSGSGDRHPKIGKGVLISAGAKILGNIRVGDGAKIGAGSLVLEDVAPHTTVVGVPARAVGRPASESPALSMNHGIETQP